MMGHRIHGESVPIIFSWIRINTSIELLTFVALVEDKEWSVVLSRTQSVLSGWQYSNKSVSSIQLFQHGTTGAVVDV